MSSKKDYEQNGQQLTVSLLDPNNDPTGINNEPEESQKSKFQAWFQKLVGPGGTRVLIYCACLLVAAVGNSIFFKKMTNHMTNYPYFLSQLTTVVYVPIFFGIVAYENSRGELNEETINFPKIKFFWMGVFDSLAGIFMLFGGVHTSGSTQALLQNAVIPMTMGLSILILSTKYRITQYLGATIILGGVAAVIVPQFLNSSGGDDKPLFNILFLLAMAPQAMSSVYKEVAFKGADDVGVNWLQAWVALFQLGFGFILLPLNTLSFLGDSAVSWSDLPNALGNGAKCLVGVNSILPTSNVTGCYTGDEISGIPPCDDCNQAFIPVLMYLLFNCFYNLFITLVIKNGTAALMFIVLTLRLPLVQMAFAISFINNPPDSFSVYAIVGLILIIFGLILYRYQPTAPDDKEKENGKALDDDQEAQAENDELGNSAVYDALAGPNTLGTQADLPQIHPHHHHHHNNTGNNDSNEKSRPSSFDTSSASLVPK